MSQDPPETAREQIRKLIDRFGETAAEHGWGSVHNDYARMLLDTAIDNAIDEAREAPASQCAAAIRSRGERRGLE